MKAVEGSACEVTPLRPCFHGEIFGIRLIVHGNGRFISFATLR